MLLIVNSLQYNMYMDPEVPVNPEYVSEAEPENAPATSPQTPKFRQLVPVLILTALLPVLGLAVASRQSISGLAAQIKCNRLAKVMISPGSLNTFVGNSPTYLSALAYTVKNEPVYSGVTYEWGLSSTNSVGDLKPDKNLAAFIPQNPGTGNIWVKAKNSCTKTPVTKSVFVTVYSSPNPSPTASLPTPTRRQKP